MGRREDMKYYHKKCKIRFEMLRDRMKACEKEHPDTHKVSLLEIDGWIEELESDKKYEKIMVRAIEEILKL